jgi:amino acid adenylation domain-containing protein/non-ribosomal peptide synthase protein (TIGR01720 family)
LSMIDRLRREGMASEIRLLFTAPTLRALSEAIAGTSQVKIEVPPNLIPPGSESITPQMLPLVELRQREIDAIVAGVPGGAANVKDIYPLAPLQEGILFHHLMNVWGDTYLHHFLLAFETRERLDDFLEALRGMIARHDILRTAVAWEGLREPAQVVWREAPLPFEEVALDPSQGEIADQLLARFGPQRTRPDVGRAPLMRCVVAHDAAKGRWLLLWLRHHLIDDNTTLKLTSNELQAHLLGQADQLPAPQPFRNFVAQARLGRKRAEEEAFFREMLGDVEEPTAPFGLLEGQDDGSEIQEARVIVGEGLARRLRERARVLGVSAASLCHVAWGRVLGGAAGREDVVFGTVLFGRMGGGEGADRGLGLFINTLPIRLRVGSDSIERSVRKTQALLGDLLKYENASLALAQRCSAVAAPMPLFSSLLNYRYGPREEETSPQAALASLGIEVLDSEEKTNYPLVLVVDDLGDGFALKAQTARSVEPGRICGYMVTALERMVEALESAPETEVRAIEVLPGAERRQLLEEWNETWADYSEEKCVHELFEEQAEKNPESVAVVYQKQELTYRELNERANQLANLLIGEGVGPEDVVAMALPRSLEMIVSLLGILKAGAAYLPIDTDYPAERVAFMLADAEPARLLSIGSVRGLPEGLSKLLLDRPELARKLKQSPVTNPGNGKRIRPLRPQNPAYVIYTSGSTGKPKGAVIEHKAIVNRLEWMRAHYSIAPDDRILQKTPATFDVSVWEFFLPLIAGATLVVAPPDSHKDPSWLASLIREHRITTVHFIPAMLAMFIADPAAAGITLRRVFCSGEELLAQLRDRFHAVVDAELHNLYGPTEASVDVTYWAAPPEDESDPVPIGFPVWNTRMYVLNDRLRPVPPGVTGEIYIGGLQLSRGYLGRPALTAERFIPNPFVEGGSRMYRTGDLGRRRADGNIEYLGRSDQQVKIRGFRIELGEIETTLREEAEIEQAVVVARENHAGEKRLVGYVVPARGRSIDSSAIRQRLAQRLPDYMVPAAIVELGTLPLMPNGKLDRRALPEAESIPTAVWRAPRTPEEEILCKLFAEVLGLERVGLDDNFFELGGDSILSIQLVSRARQAGLLIMPRDVFQHRRVETLAAIARVEDRSRVSKPEIATGALPTTPIMRWLEERGGPIGRFSQSMLLQVPGRVGKEALKIALQAVLDHHDALRLQLMTQPESGEWRLEIAPPGAIKAEDCTQQIEITGLGQTERQTCIYEEAAAAGGRLDPRAGVMIQAVWFDAGLEQSGRLLLVIHHLAIDGVSWRILIPDLRQAWEAVVAGQQPDLGVKSSSFRQWARELTVEAQDLKRAKELPFWIEMMREPAPLISMGMLDPGRDTSGEAQHFTMKLPSDITGPLLTTVPAAFHGSINDALLTALVIGVAGWRRVQGQVGSNALLIDLEGHGREEIFNDINLSRTIGWFTSLFPVRLDPGELDLEEAIGGGLAIGRALKLVKEQLRRLPDGGLGYGLLRYLNPETRTVLAELEKPQIGFNYLGRMTTPEGEDWGIAPESEALNARGDQEMPLAHCLEVNALTVDRSGGPELRATWSWAPRLLREQDVRDLAERWFQALAALVRHVADAEAGGRTPSDLPLVSLTQAEIERLEREHQQWAQVALYNYEQTE